MKHVIVGTAGHIDHGKSALVAALTGTHPDRLEEEKRRGITIDIGFAFLNLGEIRIGFVDVPGHERFVRNMLAGAGGIDLVLSDLVMPQMDGNEMVRRMKDISPEVPMMLVSGTVKAFERANRADAFLPKGACTPVEMLERIRMMIARKRGPKKAVAPAVHSPVSAQEAAFPAGILQPALAS